MSNPRIPITIFNGFLGAGKTTIILNLLKQLDVDQVDQNTTIPNINSTEQGIDNQMIDQNKKYSVVWIKNEFGVNEIDSILAQQSSIASVKEITNGCLCCTLVGRLSDSLYEILIDNKVKCDRIIIETSGSAFPTTLVQEINRVSFQNENNPKVLTESTPNVGTIYNENGNMKQPQQHQEQDHQEQDNPPPPQVIEGGYRPALPVYIDGVICVVDALNYYEYSDTSFTAKTQAQYTDLILLNKHELIGTTLSTMGERDAKNEPGNESSPIMNISHTDLLPQTYVEASITQQETIDQLKDLLLELSPETPIVKTNKGWINYQVVFGLDSVLWSKQQSDPGSNGNDPNSTQLENLPMPPYDSNTTHQVPIGLEDVDVIHLEWVTPIKKNDSAHNRLEIASPVQLHSFEKFLTQLHIFNCIRAKGIVLIEMSLSQYQIIEQNQHSKQMTGNSADNLLSATTNNNETNAISIPTPTVVLPVILNWALGRWSFYPIPNFTPHLVSTGTYLNTNIPPLIFSQSSLYNEPHGSKLDHDSYQYAHSKLTLFGAAGNIATFSFQKMVTRHLPVTIRKQCCANDTKPHNNATTATTATTTTTTNNNDLNFGGFITVLSKEHSHNHNH